MLIKDIHRSKSDTYGDLEEFIVSGTTDTFPRRLQSDETTASNAETRRRPLIPGLPNRVVDAEGVVKRNNGVLNTTTHGRRVPVGNSKSASPPSEGRVLIGEGIRFKGHFGACQTLTVGGIVDAELPSGNLEILETGRFYGVAVVDDAVIHGRFDGTLTVNGTLTLTSRAQVRGKIRYAALSIETGGRIGGDIDHLDADALNAAADENL